MATIQLHVTQMDLFLGKILLALSVTAEQFRKQANCPCVQGRTNRGQLFHDNPLILYILKYGNEIFSYMIIG